VNVKNETTDEVVKEQTKLIRQQMSVSDFVHKD
jgi:hypothetical protein